MLEQCKGGTSEPRLWQAKGGHMNLVFHTGVKTEAV